MELILSTSNILQAGSSDFRRAARSNAELLESLRSNFATAQELAQEQNPAPDSDIQQTHETPNIDWRLWTKQQGSSLLIPDPSLLSTSSSTLQEKRDNYDITLKLFFLPSASLAKRDQHVSQALDLVKTELGITTIDLLILSLPRITFDEVPSDPSTNNPTHDPSITSTDETTRSWSTLESHVDSTISKLGIAEFSSSRLLNLLHTSQIKPSVGQINLRDCCSVPPDLLSVARKNGVELLVHNDCSDILPQGTLRELLGGGQTGAGILGETGRGEKRKTLHGEEVGKIDDGKGDGGNRIGEVLHGEVLPQWVVKYTAVAKDLGVVESKGYFALAELVQ